MDLPLFPLHTVLCPGVALPLHVFEERYKTMVERCLAEDSPFGVVLIREGREVGPGELAVAGIGTVAEIREATRYSDGRFDLLTLGTRRFRLEGVDPEAEPYLVGQITPLDEVLGEAARAKALGERVVQLFIRYLEIVQIEDAATGRVRRGRGKTTQGPAPDAGTTGPTDVAADVPSETVGEPWSLSADELIGKYSDDYTEADALADAYEAAERERAEASAGAEAAGDHPSGSAAEQLDDSRAAFLDEAARRLTIPDDPTVLSYLLSGIVQVESIRRQLLLEMPTTELRLVELQHLLEREIALLGRGLATYAPDPRLVALRRN
jgi:ATP-dependent Lon protease